MNFDWHERSVLVVGASTSLAGFIVKDLLTRGANVHCTVKDWVPNSLLVRDGLLADVAVCQLDERDGEGLFRVLDEYRIDTIFHLPDAPRSGESKPRTFQAHIEATWTLLDAACRVGHVRTAVLAGTEKLSHDETHGAFDVARSCAEQLGQYYAREANIKIAATRTPAIYGPGDLNWNSLIPNTIRSVLRGRPPVFDAEPEELSHYLYAEDAARAHVCLAERLMESNGTFDTTYRIPENAGLKANEVVTRVLSVMGSALRPVFRPSSRPPAPREAEGLASVPSFSVQTDFDTGLRHAVRWYEQLLATPAANSARPSAGEAA